MQMNLACRKLAESSISFIFYSSKDLTMYRLLCTGLDAGYSEKQLCAEYRKEHLPLFEQDRVYFLRLEAGEQALVDEEEDCQQMWGCRAGKGNLV